MKRKLILWFFGAIVTGLAAASIVNMPIDLWGKLAWLTGESVVVLIAVESSL
jgi:hypothetical protein